MMSDGSDCLTFDHQFLGMYCTVLEFLFKGENNPLLKQEASLSRVALEIERKEQPDSEI